MDEANPAEGSFVNKLKGQATRKITEANPKYKIKPGYDGIGQVQSTEDSEEELRDDIIDGDEDDEIEELPAYRYEEGSSGKVFQKGDIFCVKEAKIDDKTAYDYVCDTQHCKILFFNTTDYQNTKHHYMSLEQKKCAPIMRSLY